MRKIIFILSGLCLVLLLGYVAYRGYGVWKQNHWMSLARQFAAKRDIRNEFLSLEQVLQANPRNLDACRMAAALAEAAHSDSALTWRKKILELAPNSLDDRLALAQTAVFAHDFATAADALAGVDAAGKKTLAYFNVAGELALATSRPDDAQADFAEAARLDPSNPAPELSLAVVELHRTNALDMAEARINLKRISMNSTNVDFRNQAKRELAMDAMRFKDYPTAVSLTTDLVKGTNVVINDKLLWLDALMASRSPDYNSALAACERDAAGNPDQLSRLSLWMMERNLSAQALRWLRTLPETTQTNRPACVLIAQCEMLTQDWSGVQNSIQKQDWGELEFTRHAYLARALRELGLAGASKAEWDVALKSANDMQKPARQQDEELTTLFRMAADWKWPAEAQQILWSIVNAFPQEQWAGTELAGELYAAGGTRPLMQLFSTQAGRNPSDMNAKNNLALTAMLLRASEMKPYDLAREVYRKVPTNSNYLCTYAFSLYLQGQNAQALKLMQQLAPQALDDHSTAGYYGLILNSVGDRSKAIPYLKRATSGMLLPEERDMFQHALQ